MDRQSGAIVVRGISDFFWKFFVPREVDRSGDFDFGFGFTNLPKLAGSDRAEIGSTD
jgi:hypothetical protein